MPKLEFQELDWIGVRGKLDFVWVNLEENGW